MVYGSSEVDTFLRHVKPEWTKAKRDAVVDKLHKINLSNIGELAVANPYRVNQALFNLGERKFTKSTLAAMTGHRSFFNNIGYSALRESTGTRLQYRHDTPGSISPPARHGPKWANKDIAIFYRQLQEDEFYVIRRKPAQVNVQGKLRTLFCAWRHITLKSSEIPLDTQELAKQSPIHAFREALRRQCFPLSIAARLRRMLQLDTASQKTARSMDNQLAPISLTLDDFAELVYHLKIPLHEICPSIVHPDNPHDGYRALFRILASDKDGKTLPTLSLADLMGSEDVIVNTMEHWNIADRYFQESEPTDWKPGWLARSSPDLDLHAAKIRREQDEIEAVRTNARINSVQHGKLACQDSDTFTRVRKMAHIRREEQARSQKTERSVRMCLSDMTRQRQEIVALQSQMALATRGSVSPKKECHVNDLVQKRLRAAVYDCNVDIPLDNRESAQNDRLANLLLKHPPRMVDSCSTLRRAMRCCVLPVRKFVRDEQDMELNGRKSSISSKC